ncbi:MAG: GtrA family protein [Lachnospiraceae bacterium]|nr:GtrA family protein [Lachnospiraceae bacterium]
MYREKESKKITELYGKLIQAVRFIIVGFINTIVSLIIYYILIALHIDYNTATVVGYIGSSVLGYFLNRIWVFQIKKISSKNSLIKYYIVYGTALLLNLCCMHFWIQTCCIDKRIAPILTLCITIPYNFTLSKLWVFQDKKEEGLDR